MKDRNIAELTFRQNHYQSPNWEFVSSWNKVEGIIPTDYKERLDNFITPLVNRIFDRDNLGTNRIDTIGERDFTTPIAISEDLSRFSAWEKNAKTFSMG